MLYHLDVTFLKLIKLPFSKESFFTVFKVASMTFLIHFSGCWKRSKMSPEAVGVGVSIIAWDAVNQC
jgi:hypothetical protein